MASSVSSPASPVPSLPIPGNLTGHPLHSSAQSPLSTRLPLPCPPSVPPISGPSNAGHLFPVIRSGWRDPSAFSHPLLAEFVGEYGMDEERASSLSPSAAESVAAAYPALANAHVLWHKSGYYNCQVTVREDEPDETLFRRFRKEVMKSGVIQECKRRQFFEDKQAKKKRKAKKASRKNRRKPFASAGSSSSPFVLPHQASRSQAGGVKKPGKRSNRLHRARLPPLDLKEVSKKDEDEEEDNWELPEVEIPY